MAKAKRAVWLARDGWPESVDAASYNYVVCATEPFKQGARWYYSRTDDPNFCIFRIDPDQSPVVLAPGAGPVKVWLVAE